MSLSAISKKHKSHRTYIKDGDIIWESDERESLAAVPIKQIKIIGENTTNAGPIQDDWFYVFILADGEIRQVSAYASGLEEMLGQVGQMLSTDLTGQLASSTDLNTRILWPTQFRGQEMFKSIKRTPIGLLETIKEKFGLLGQEMELTANLKDYLK